MDKLKAFLDYAHSPYHAVEAVRQMLEGEGYQPLQHSAAHWDLIPGGKYYMIRGGSALIAFRIPAGTPAGFMMSAAHCDRPGFKVKEKGELAAKYNRLATEKYGGMLISTWLDRPLSIAGRVTVETEQGVENRLVDIDRDLLLIPNVAIHLNRGVNDGYKWNVAVDTLPLLGSACTEGKLQAILEEAAGGKVLGHDLYLYPRQKASVWGLEGEYISAAGLDDLACVWGCAQGFLQAGENAAVNVLCVFDNEEIGSTSCQGAASGLLDLTLQKICTECGMDRMAMYSRSFMVSADNAHAVHPNHPELSDSVHGPVVNGGVALKNHAERRYTTDGLTAALFRKICSRTGVQLQTFYNRADLPSGSTLGIVSQSHVSVNSVDIGLPQLAMHSAYETAGVKDVKDLEKIMSAYFGCCLDTHETDEIVLL